MRVKFYIALGALVTTLSCSCLAALPSSTSSFFPAVRNDALQRAQQQGLIGHNQAPQQGAENTGKKATDPQVPDNQNVTDLNQSLLDKLRNAVEKNIGLDSSSGPGGGNLACAWANSKIRKDFLQDVANDSNFGPDVAKALDIGWSNGVSDTASKLSKSAYWMEVPFNQAPDGAIVLSEGGWSGRTHGHIGNELNGRVVSNSSGKARLESNYSNQGWLNYFKSAKAFIPVLSKFMSN